jgi:G3E family GTPase
MTQVAINPIRFLLLGGFLGSGKTTALLRLARHYVAAGKRVGIIANDQAENLVDTESFRRAGFPTEEVPGGCFCCRFDELIAAAGRLADGQKPDVLLAEPVGSCTDLVSTVIRPLQKLHADRFVVAPYITLLDPERAHQALTGAGPAGFSAKVTYLFKMQQHEADVVAINKIDLLGPERREELIPLVRRNFPQAEVVAISARTGEGFERLIELVEGRNAGQNPTDVDYDLYAEGEAELGWLNAEYDLKSGQAFDADSLLLDMLADIRRRLVQRQAEPAHVKMTIRAGDVLAVANLVDSRRPPELSQPSGQKIAEARLTINARVEDDPARLRELVQTAVDSMAVQRSIAAECVTLASFAPGRPRPRFRMP